MEYKKVNRYEKEPMNDPCGLLRELYAEESISFAHNISIDDAREHKHEKMKEFYYVDEGEGQLNIDGNVIDIKRGDLIQIPKFTWHYLKKIPDKKLEVLVITIPRFDLSDMIFRE